jgi:hypothetical protein
MSDTGEQVVRICEKLAKAKLIAQFREGDRLGAFRSAKQSDPQLAAALATDFAEGLRGSLLPATHLRRAAILSQAADLLRSTAQAKTKENLEAIAWLLAEASLAEERARQLEIAAIILSGLVALGCLAMLALA